MPLSEEQKANARIIVQVGRSVGASDRDILVGLMTSLQESSLKNINYGDRDSLGLFQQRPSMGWGSADQLTDPVYAATTFFKGKQGNPGLFSVKNRDSLPLTVAAQKVQRSAFPDAYAKHESVARQLLAELGGGETTDQAAPATAALKQDPAQPQGLTTSEQAMAGMSATGAPGLGAAQTPGTGAAGANGLGPVTPAGPVQNDDDANSWWRMPEVSRDDFAVMMQASPALTGGGSFGSSVVGQAASYIGTPYVWGGNGYEGVDCSGLVQQVFRAQGIELPRLSADQARAGARVGLREARAGDLIAWDNSSRNNGADHIGILTGDGHLIEAPRPGLNVRRRKLTDADYANAWAVRIERK